jgi:hypothetical protein
MTLQPIKQLQKLKLRFCIWAFEQAGVYVLRFASFIMRAYRLGSIWNLPKPCLKA